MSESHSVPGCSSGAGSPSEPGGLQGATRHLQECGQTTSSPGDSWCAQEPANRAVRLGAGPRSSVCEECLAIPSLLSLPAACSPEADLTPQKAPEPLEQEMRMGSCIHCPADHDKLLLTLLVPGLFPNQGFKFDLIMHLSLGETFFFFLRTQIL